MARTEEQWAEAKALIPRLAAKGIVALYGNTKGHGFWLYQSTPEEIARFEETRGYTHIDGVCIQNDGKTSGNPSFHLFRDAEALAAPDAEGGVA